MGSPSQRAHWAVTPVCPQLWILCNPRTLGDLGLPVRA